MTELPGIIIPEPGEGVSFKDIIADSANTVHVKSASMGSFGKFLVHLLKTKKTNVVAIVSDDQTAGNILNDALYFFKEEGMEKDFATLPFLCPAFDLSPYDGSFTSRKAYLDFNAALFKMLKTGMEPPSPEATPSFAPGIIIVSALSLMTTTIPSLDFAHLCKSLKPGDTIIRQELTFFLKKAGYLKTPLVEEKGTFAFRGNLVDIFPPYLPHPVRIDFFGEEIDNIKFFDPTGQLSKDKTQKIWIHPASFIPIPNTDYETEEIIKKIRKICDDANQPTVETDRIIEEIKYDRFFAEQKKFAPAYFKNKANVFDYFPADSLFCVLEPEKTDTIITRQFDLINTKYKNLKQNNIPCYKPQYFYTEPCKVKNLILKNKCFAFHPLEIHGGEKNKFLKCTDPYDPKILATGEIISRIRVKRDLSENIGFSSRLKDFLKKLHKLSYTLTITAHTDGQAQRLVSMLENLGVNPVLLEKNDKPYFTDKIIIKTGSLRNGFVFPADGICYISEEEFFGRRVRRKKSTDKSKTFLEDIGKLKDNDLVVHDEHGIGKYVGLVRQTIRERDQDFLLIIYKGGDKLYLPVYRLNQVKKFKGGDSGTPLDKLGGKTFSIKKAKVRRQAMQMASELINLYAKRSLVKSPKINPEDEMYSEFEASFPFEETDDQAKTITEVADDLTNDVPMDRLVCGDVGFGKTEVALRAAFRTIMSGFQVVVLVPTTILAQQHYQTFKERFGPWPLNVKMLSRFQTTAENAKVILELKDGKVDIVVGTHRLLSKDVHINKLGLLVIDEEHKFGVSHKERIKKLKASVNTLAMTATPIPRTLQMAIGKIRDLSLITTAPQDRLRIETILCQDDSELISNAMKREIARGGQVFFVHNRVKSIKKAASRVKKMVPGARVAVGHGQMDEKELEQVMLDFVAGRYDILVSTTIIESGLDIPRANTIIINRADTMGLAGLYQLRGRVGRSNVQAFAYLVIPPFTKLSNEARARVEAMLTYSDLGAGFFIASADLEQRGAGNLLGREQAGNINAVGLSMFCELLEEAALELKGKSPKFTLEPELTLENPGYFNEEYIREPGQRLSLYKKLASARDEMEVEDIAASVLDRYGPLPQDAKEYIDTMILKALCREKSIPGVEVNSKKCTFHLARDSKVSPSHVIKIIKKEKGYVLLSQDLKLTVRFKQDNPAGTDGAIAFLHGL